MRTVTRRPLQVAATVLTALAGVTVCTPARAQLSPGEPLAPVIGRLPRSTALVVVAPRPGRVLDALRTPWKRLGPLAAGVSAEALGGWAAFARELGYGPGEGFEALTSGGLAVVVGAVPRAASPGAGEHGAGAPEPRWAVLSVVKAPVAANLRTRLNAAPHAVIGGVPVLSIEGGRFALVCRPLVRANADPGQAPDEILALTPMDDQAFLATVSGAVDAVPPADAHPDTLASTPAFALGAATVADLLVLAAEQPGLEPDWDRGSVIAVTLAPRTWTIDSWSACAPGKERAAGRLPPEAGAWFDAWSPRAAVMIAGSGFKEIVDAISEAQPTRPPQFGHGARLTPLIEGLARVGAVEAAVVYIGAPHGADLHDPAPGSGLCAWGAVRLRQRSALAPLELDAAGCAVAGAVERDWRSTLASRPAGDRAESGPPPSVFGSLPPDAPRAVSVRLAPGTPLTGNAEDTTAGAVCWWRIPAPGAGPGPAEPDWAVMTVEPRSEPGAIRAPREEVNALLSTRPAVPGREWSWRAVIRPRAVVNSLPLPLGIAAGLVGAQSVGDLRLEAWEEHGRRRSRTTVEWPGQGPDGAAVPASVPSPGPRR